MCIINFAKSRPVNFPQHLNGKDEFLMNFQFISLPSNKIMVWAN